MRNILIKMVWISFQQSKQYNCSDNTGMHVYKVLFKHRIIALPFQIMKTLLVSHKNIETRGILLIRKWLIALRFWNRTT